MEIIIVQPDQLLYKLAFQKPGTTDYVQTGNIVSGCTAAEM